LQCQDCTIPQALRLLLWALEDVCSGLLGLTTSLAICCGPLFVVYPHSTSCSTETCSKLSSPTSCTYCLAFYDFFYHYPVDLLDVNVPEPFFPCPVFFAACPAMCSNSWYLRSVLSFLAPTKICQDSPANLIELRQFWFCCWVQCSLATLSISTFHCLVVVPCHLDVPLHVPRTR